MNTYEKNLYVIMGEMLRDARIQRKLTLELASVEVGLTSKTVQRYEYGERKIKEKTLQALLDLYGVDHEAFMTEVKRRHLGDAATLPADAAQEQILATLAQNAALREIVLLLASAPEARLRAYLQFIKDIEATTKKS
ncbi:MAG: helix-turn-helix domain-containing protein [Lachnospiraceae bacterium]